MAKSHQKYSRTHILNGNKPRRAGCRVRDMKQTNLIALVKKTIGSVSPDDRTHRISELEQLLHGIRGRAQTIPRCEHTDLVKKGRTKTEQRYLCKGVGALSDRPRTRSLSPPNFRWRRGKVPRVLYRRCNRATFCTTMRGKHPNRVFYAPPRT